MKIQHNSESDTYFDNVQRLQQHVNRTFGKVATSVADFEMLSDKVKLSVQSLRRFYGKIDANKKLSLSSLNLICNYVGFADWQSFCKNNFTSPIAQITDIQSLIYAFYDTVANAGTGFFRKELRDTHETYAKIILQDIPFANTFLERYLPYPKITQSLYPWFPYYDKMVDSSYIRLIERYLETNPLEHLHVCQNSFLAYGAFCGGNKKVVDTYVARADQYIESVWNEYPDSFFHYPETRYTIAKVIQAYLYNNENEAIRIAEATLKRNRQAKPLFVFNNYFDTPDILVFKLCNALLWLGKPEFAIDVYKAYGNDRLPSDATETYSEKFVYEKDSRFAAQTVTMMHLFDQDIPLLDSKSSPHWKTHDYEEVQEYLITLKATPKTQLSKRHALKNHLRELAQKTNYKVIEDLIRVFE